MKKIIILIALTFTFSTSEAISTQKWEKVWSEKPLDNQHILLYDGRIIKLIGITPPDINSNAPHDYCYARPTFRILKELLNNKEIKIHKDQESRNTDRKYPRHVKLPDGQNLTEFMLKNGMGKFKSDSHNTKYDKKYQKAESIGKKNQVGIWGDCGKNKYLRIRKLGSQAWNYFRKQFGNFLAPVSSGRVKKVLSGTNFILENGIEISLIGIQAPSSKDSRKGFSCFGKEAKNYLEKLILGKNNAKHSID